MPFAAALRAFGSGRPTVTNGSFNSRGFYVFTRLQCDQPMETLQTLPSVWLRSNRAQHRAGAPQQCLPGGEQQLPLPNPFLAPIRSRLGTVLHVAIFSGRSRLSGCHSFPRAKAVPTLRQSQLLNADIYRPHSSENSFLPAANKTSRETSSANGRRSSGGLCGHCGRCDRPATIRRPRCVTAGPSGGAQQSGRSPARGCPSAPRGLQSARFPHGNRLCSAPFLESGPVGLRSAPLPSPALSRQSPR